jgi:large subunit ribosomal protein L31
MKTGVHPEYRKVLFIDSSNGKEWFSYSTLASGESRDVEGETVPIIKLDISAHSHPFWTGQARSVDAEGRIDRFKRRYAERSKK